MDSSSSELTAQQQQLLNTPVVQLNIIQLRLILSIIEAGTARAAWKPEELSAIGQLYDTLKTGLAQVTKTTPAAPAAVSEKSIDKQ